MIIKEAYHRDFINVLISDMENIGYDYNGTDNRGRLLFDSKDGNSSLAFPDWDEVKKYLDSNDFPELYKFESCMKEDTDESTIKEETEEDIVEYRLEAADYAMYKAVQCSYVEIVSDNTFGKYEVRYNNVTVTVEFELGEDTAKYVYTIDGEGPYAHDSYEYIRRDIMDYIDTHFEDEDDLDESCIKEEDSSKADDIDFIMNKYVDNKPVSGSYGSYDRIEIIDNKGKGKYTVSCNGYSVDIDFDLDDNSAQYVYYIDGEGPYAHDSYEYITKDVAHYIDWAVRHFDQDDDLDESQCLTENSLPDWQDTIMVEIRNILKNNRIYADIYDDTNFRGNDDAFVLCVEIENGDWKHEHKRADILITDTVNHYDNMEITKIGEETIGDSEDDTYSSIHKFHILRYPDDNGFDFDDIEQLDIKFPKRESVKRKNRKSVKESIDLTDYKFKFSTKDGYKIYSKFDKSLNKGLWVAQKDGEEPFEISYEQARGFEPINPTDRVLQHKVRQALKMESKSIKEDYKNDLKKFADANKDKLNQLAQKNGFRLYNDYYYRKTTVDREYITVLCFDFDEVNSKADIDKFERALDRYFGKFDYRYFLELLPRVKRICIYY